MNRIKIHWYDYALEGVVDGTDERVKRIEGYEYHFITTEGRVLSARVGSSQRFAFDSLKERRGGIHKQGYLMICLSENGSLGSHYIHRLVAEAFIPNPHNLPVVNHLNFPSNRVEDLEWETQRGNVAKGKLAIDTRNWTIEDEEGNRVTVDSLYRFAKENNCCKGSLSQGSWNNGFQVVARGGVPVQRRMKDRHKNNNYAAKTHLIQDPQGELLEVTDLASFVRELGIDRRNLYSKYGSKGYKKIG